MVGAHPSMPYTLGGYGNLAYFPYLLQSPLRLFHPPHTSHVISCFPVFLLFVPQLHFSLALCYYILSIFSLLHFTPPCVSMLSPIIYFSPAYALSLPRTNWYRCENISAPLVVTNTCHTCATEAARSWQFCGICIKNCGSVFVGKQRKRSGLFQKQCCILSRDLSNGARHKEFRLTQETRISKVWHRNKWNQLTWSLFPSFSVAPVECKKKNRGNRLKFLAKVHKEETKKWQW